MTKECRSCQQTDDSRANELGRIKKINQATYPQDTNEAGGEQIELRTQGYREFLASALPKLPKGIVTAAQQDDLVETGVELHGVPEDAARATIRDVCNELGIRYITLEQARQHIAELVDDKLATASWLPNDVRDRIVAEAEARATRMRDDTRFVIEQQMKQLRADLTREAIEAAVNAAEQNAGWCQSHIAPSPASHPATSSGRLHRAMSRTKEHSLGRRVIAPTMRSGIPSNSNRCSTMCTLKI